MKKFLSFTALILLLNQVLFAQTERVLFYNGPGNAADQSRAISVDKNGIIYITGNSWGGSNNSEDFATIKYSPSGTQQWVSRYNGTGSSTDMAYDVVTDNAGNVYVTGWAYTEPALLDCGTPDYITVKYNSSGVQQWMKKYNGPGNGNDYAYAIAIDEQSNVYVTGASIASNGKEDFATVKYNSSGAQQWVARYDGPSHLIDIANSIIADRYGNVYVTGSSAQTGAGTDYVTVKYNSAGVQQWAARYNGPGNSDDVPYSIGIDNGGNVTVTGGSKGSGTNFDYATIKYSPTGTMLWNARFNGSSNNIDEAKSLIVDAYSYIYVTGYSYSSSQNYNYVTIRYDPDGVELWSRTYNGPANGIDKACDIAVSKHNCRFLDAPCFYFKVYVTGQSQNDYLTVCYDEDGVEQWTKRYNSTNNGEDIPSAIYVKDGCDTVYITGTSNNNYCTVVYYPIKLDAKNEINKNITDKLEQNYPNPFNPTTKIIASVIPSKGGKQDVRIAIYDVLGKEVAAFLPHLRGGQDGPDIYEVSWNASNLTSGIYFYTLHINGNLIDRKKMVLVK